ncbi:trypsin-like peptidase domain-containing protein [Streptomyces sp. NPDC005799]|uniref:S1C family serine protease n=1 Tax=Streptomyces sp. NPDC005799 TaxID=3154678 RepID=UPI003407946C
MNEGKPTRPKWWHRGVRETSTGHADAPPTDPPLASTPTPTLTEPEAHGDAEGDFRLALPVQDRGPAAATLDGDFELARPAAVGGTGGAAVVGAAEAAEGGSDECSAAGTTDAPRAASVDGDYELPLPRAATDTGGAPRPTPGPEPETPGGAGTPAGAELLTPTVAVGEADRPDEAASDSGDCVTPRPGAAPEPHPTPATRQTPLHDPDPYSTPPYGEPGPWAPAPPVQHPAAPPTQDTPIPPPHNTPGPHTTPPVGPRPAPLPDPALASPVVAASAPLPDPAPTAPVVPPPGPLPDPPLAPPTGLTPPPPQDPASTPTPTPSLDPDPSHTPNPWQNYDPWAPAPFQQSGVGVDDNDTRRRRVRRRLVSGAVVLALVSSGVGGLVGAYVERDGGLGTVTLPQAGKEPAGRAPDSVAGIAARALPSVVTLHVTGVEESGTGTGFVLDDLGHILTNNHVVEPAGSSGKITVTFNSGDTAKATVVGRDSGYDLAVVKVTGVRGLKPLPLGNSDNVQVGDPVVAIGAPFDLAGTVTSGIISAKERPITAGGDSTDGSDVSYVDALQTDAPINPGNSGGPLLDSRGRVIGINSAIRSADDGSDSGSGQAGSIGLGFAIPVNQARRVAEELINTGKATHPVIGVTLDMNYTGDGARVGKKAADGVPAVTAGGPGAKAGIKAGDVITAVDGVRVHSGDELIVRTRAHRPGDRLRLTVRRGGGERTISLVLGSSDSG